MFKLYNTLSRQKEEFKSIESGKVKIYYCGPTVYWTQHIGNLRGAFCADSVVRIFKYLGYEVKFVRNYTDVGHLTSDGDEGEDKMEKAIKRDHLDPQAIAEKYIKIYENDTRELNFLEPDFKPRATENIPEMIAMVKTLLEKGFAYETDLAIYFEVAKFPNYTQLSRQVLEDNKNHAGSGEVVDNQKKNPHDFALWFFKAGKHQNAVQFWPFEMKETIKAEGEALQYSLCEANVEMKETIKAEGEALQYSLCEANVEMKETIKAVAEGGQNSFSRSERMGFPGWHIECSAMSKKFLGSSLDLHLGGIEHIPVHHTNEIAQSECANGVKYVNYWLHNEHLLVNNKKMSKSEGTGFSLAEIKEKGFNPLALRFLFLQAHYRSQLNFTWEAMQAAQNGLDKLKSNFKLQTSNFNLNSEDHFSELALEIKRKFKAELEDDFNLPRALAIVYEVLKSDLTASEKSRLILDFDQVLGLNLYQEEESKVIPQIVQDLVLKRKLARKNKNWQEADLLREEMKKLGYLVEDIGDESVIIAISNQNVRILI